MCYTLTAIRAPAVSVPPQVIRLGRAVLQTPSKSSVPPELLLYKNSPSRTHSESTLRQLLIPLHFNSPRISVYKKPGEGVPLQSPKVLQLVTRNSRPRQQPRHARHAIIAIHHSSLATMPFRMIFFAHRHPLTTMESYSCKKQGRVAQGLRFLCFHALGHSFAS
jgi:hypothetical protein